MDPVSIATQMSESTFAEMVACSPRQVREVLFSKMGIKAKKKGIGLNVHEKRDERTRKLHEKLKDAEGKREADVCRELIRTWLYTKRPMLKAALDFIGVKNDDGLVDTELDFFADLSEKRVRELSDHLLQKFDPEHVRIYFHFVEIPHVDKVLK